MKRLIHNPVLPGFRPDPSALRVGADFYLVNSTFAYWPGLPIHHSRDLVDWTLIGHAVDRPGQLDFSGQRLTRGLFAPTLRYARGRFYLVCTAVDVGGNFVMTADDPAGPWSDPVWLEDAPGIDPSLFFDDDGRCWYCGTRPAPEGERYSGNWEVWLREFDAEKLRLTGPDYGIWRGALRDCIWPEGPHLYRKDGRYYLMAAEGGTDRQHAVSVARADALTGPWAGNPVNPILTHRHLGPDAAVINVGHADLFDDGTGAWWLACLASRPVDGHCLLGRETFLAPVSWVDGWPVVSPGTGRLEACYPAPDLAPAPVPALPAAAPLGRPLTGPGLSRDWMTLRVPAGAWADPVSRPGRLALKAVGPDLRGTGPTAFLGRRLRHHDWYARTALEFSPGTEGAAGFVLLQSETHQIRLELASTARGGLSLRLVRASGGPDEVLAESGWAAPSVALAAQGRGLDLAFFAGPSFDALAPFAAGVDGRALSTESAGGFIGVTVGLFVVGRETSADFLWFEYGPLETS